MTFEITFVNVLCIYVLFASVIFFLIGLNNKKTPKSPLEEREDEDKLLKAVRFLKQKKRQKQV